MKKKKKHNKILLKIKVSVDHLVIINNKKKKKKVFY